MNSKELIELRNKIDDMLSEEELDVSLLSEIRTALDSILVTNILQAVILISIIIALTYRNSFL